MSDKHSIKLPLFDWIKCEKIYGGWYFRDITLKVDLGELKAGTKAPYADLDLETLCLTIYTEEIQHKTAHFYDLDLQMLTLQAAFTYSKELKTNDRREGNE